LQNHEEQIFTLVLFDTQAVGRLGMRISSTCMNRQGGTEV